MKQRNIVVNIIIYLIFLIFLVVVLFPLVYVLVSSFKTNLELMGEPERYFPRSWTFDNYKEAWNSETLNVGRMLFNSIWFTSCSVIITLITSSVSGYVFERGEFKLRKPLFAIFSSLMFVSLGSITIYPKFAILSLIGLNKSLFGLVVLNCFGIPTRRRR